MTAHMSRVDEPKKRCLLLILDGLGDVPVPSMDGQTPLEAAHTPRLDHMAAAGHIGLVDPIGQGVTPNTHTGVGVLLGLLPEQTDLLKRGPVEASGAGRVLQPGEIAFRANFATLERSGEHVFVADRRAGRIRNGAKELAQVLVDVDLGDGVSASFHSTDQHRGALVFSGEGLHAALSDTDPGDGHTPALLTPCHALDDESRFAAGKVNHFIGVANELLREHPVNVDRERAGKLPANGVITRGAGAWFGLENLLKQREISSVLVAGCNTVSGLARIFDIRTLKEPGFTADVNTDVEAKLAAAVKALDDHDIVFVHIKATDLFSHDFKPEGKMMFIERVDEALGMLDGSNTVIALAADHTTSSVSGAHTADPVPALVYDPAAPGRETPPLVFGETACRQGSMPRQTGHEFLLRVLQALGRT